MVLSVLVLKDFKELLYFYLKMYDAYINLIKTQLQLQPQEWSFKSNKDYCQILEHVSYQQGQSYFNIIKSKHPIFYRKKKEIVIKI